MLQRVQVPAGPVFYRSPLLAELGLPHAFSTRLGGISTGVFSSLNLGNPSEGTDRDGVEHIEANYRSLSAAAGLPLARCSVHQVHGATVAELGVGKPFAAGQKADAIVSDDPTRAAAIRIADCVPILLAGEDARVCAAVHAGWRGVIAGIVPATVQAITRPYAGPIYAAIGPCISRYHFQVGPEVLAEFRRVFGAKAPINRESSDGKGYIDLPAAIALQLREAGLNDDQIDRTDRCTVEHSDEFFSHRRDHGVTGRMAALIAPRPS